MGFNEPTHTGGPVIYATIINGNFHQKVTSETPGAIARENKNGNTVHELIHTNGITGFLESMAIKESPYGKQLEMVINDMETKICVQIPVESKYFDSFASRIGNVDFSKEMIIKPYHFEPKENQRVLPNGDVAKITGVGIVQDSEKVEYYFSKDDPKDKPVPEEEMDGDDYKAFKIKERKFLRNFVTVLAAEIPTLSITGSPRSNGKITPNPAADAKWDDSIPRAGKNNKMDQAEPDINPFQVPDTNDDLPF